MNRILKALMIFNLQVLLVVPNCIPQAQDRGQKTNDQYWAETGLGSSEFEALIEDSSCQSSQLLYLSCVNSISHILKRYEKVLTTNGQIAALKAADIESRLTEKKELSPWVNLFKSDLRKISFKNLWKQIEKELVQPHEKSAVIAAGINGFLSVYKDPHTYIMPLSMYEEVVANSESRHANIGMIARRNENILVVRKVFPGSPAYIAGVRKGDQVLAINSKPVSEILPSQITELFRMRSAQRIMLEIVKTSGEKKIVEVFKSFQVYPSVVSRVLEGNQRLGLLTLHKFAKGTCDSAKEQIVFLKESGIRGLLLDLRDNPGGQVEEAACVINLFVAQGTFLFETRYLDISKVSDQYFAEQEPIYRGPMAVLINSGSASSAEIVAGALKDLDRARLVGERSFGKGSFQDGKIWGPNEKIAIFGTEGLFYFASGWTPQLVGLTPDIAVNFNEATDQREEELYLNPIMPVDSWLGPQNLAWLMENSQCPGLGLSFKNQIAGLDSDLTEEDPQVQKAQAWLSCGEKNDRNSHL